MPQLHCGAGRAGSRQTGNILHSLFVFIDPDTSEQRRVIPDHHEGIKVSTITSISNQVLELFLRFLLVLVGNVLHFLEVI